MIAVAVLSCGAAWTTTQAQSAAPKRSPAAAKPYTPPRTPWGDPQLAGVYSNDDETGVPFERPAQFEGRKIEDITPEELAALNKQRNEQFNAGVAGTEFAGGIRPPTHLIFDSFERKNSSPWLVVDPPDGKVPPLTEEARQRRASGRRRPGPRREQQREPDRAVQQLRGPGALRPLHHARHPQLDDAGRLRQLLRAHSGPGLRGPPLRDDPRAPRRSRSIAASAGRTSASACIWIWATPAAGTRATRWWSRRRISRRAAPTAAPART